MRLVLIGALLLLAGAARAAVPQLPLCSLATDPPPRLAVAPCRPAPPSAALPRRAVPQLIEPRRPPSVPRAAGVAAAPAAPAPAAPAVPSAPIPIAGCDSGGCRDPAGVRYNGGVGNAVLDPHGRLCHRDGPLL